LLTLVIDIGGTGTKSAVLDKRGQLVGDHVRVETPRPATPEALLELMESVTARHPAFDRVSIGFPGVVQDGETLTAPNLDAGWAGFDLARAVEARLARPTRVVNDAGMHGLAVIERSGTEVVVTLGTGMGFGLYIDGRYVPNVELGHHPLRKGMTYEQRVCDAELRRIGEERWKKRVGQAIDQIRHTFNFRVLYLGGGNARRFAQSELPADVVLIDNAIGLVGGIRLWEPPAKVGGKAASR
jgi:polyphosphate glucokinase